MEQGSFLPPVKRAATPAPKGGRAPSPSKIISSRGDDGTIIEMRPIGPPRDQQAIDRLATPRLLPGASPLERGRVITRKQETELIDRLYSQSRSSSRLRGAPPPAEPEQEIKTARSARAPSRLRMRSIPEGRLDEGSKEPQTARPDERRPSRQLRSLSFSNMVNPSDEGGEQVAVKPSRALSRLRMQGIPEEIAADGPAQTARPAVHNSARKRTVPHLRPLFFDPTSPTLSTRTSSSPPAQSSSPGGSSQGLPSPALSEGSNPVYSGPLPPVARPFLSPLSVLSSALSEGGSSSSLSLPLPAGPLGPSSSALPPLAERSPLSALVSQEVPAPPFHINKRMMRSASLQQEDIPHYPPTRLASWLGEVNFDDPAHQNYIDPGIALSKDQRKGVLSKNALLTLLNEQIIRYAASSREPIFSRKVDSIIHRLRQQDQHTRLVNVVQIAVACEQCFGGQMDLLTRLDAFLQTGRQLDSGNFPARLAHELTGLRTRLLTGQVDFLRTQAAHRSLTTMRYLGERVGAAGMQGIRAFGDSNAHLGGKEEFNPEEEYKKFLQTYHQQIIPFVQRWVDTNSEISRMAYAFLKEIGFDLQFSVDSMDGRMTPLAAHAILKHLGYIR